MAEKKGIPTEEEIAKLPRWARVAFAARCAWRVQPLFNAAWPEAAKKHGGAIKNAIINAERAAADVAGARLSVRVVASVDDMGSESAVADAAVRASAGAAAAARAAAIVDAGAALHPSVAGHAAALAVAAVAHAATIAGIDVGGLIRRDFELLAAAAKKERWTDKTAVPPAFFGPLWPEGQEPDWGKIAVKKKGGEERLLLRVYVPELADDDEVVDGIVELYRALNKYHIACGGRGLTIDDWQMFVREDAREGVGV